MERASFRCTCGYPSHPWTCALCRAFSTPVSPPVFPPVDRPDQRSRQEHRFPEIKSTVVAVACAGLGGRRIGAVDPARRLRRVGVQRRVERRAGRSNGDAVGHEDGRGLTVRGDTDDRELHGVRLGTPGLLAHRFQQRGSGRAVEIRFGLCQNPTIRRGQPGMHPRQPPQPAGACSPDQARLSAPGWQSTRADRHQIRKATTATNCSSVTMVEGFSEYWRYTRVADYATLWAHPARRPAARPSVGDRTDRHTRSSSRRRAVFTDDLVDERRDLGHTVAPGERRLEPSSCGEVAAVAEYLAHRGTNRARCRRAGP